MPKLSVNAWIVLGLGLSVTTIVGVLGWLYWLGSQVESGKIPAATPSTVAVKAEASVVCPEGLWKAPKWSMTGLEHFKKGTLLYQGEGDCKQYIAQMVQDAGEFVIIQFPNGKAEGKKKTAILQQTWVNGDSDYSAKEPLPPAP